MTDERQSLLSAQKRIEDLDKAWAEALIARARIEPINCDISDRSDEFCAGFLAGQASVLEEVLAGRLRLPGAEGDRG